MNSIIQKLEITNSLIILDKKSKDKIAYATDKDGKKIRLFKSDNKDQ